MYDVNCKYCVKGEDLSKIMIPVTKVDGFQLYLFRNQSYKGRTILAYNDHVAKIAELDETESAAFFQAVHKVIKAIEKAFQPDQTNIGMYADTVPHMHCHIVPKYTETLDWGKTFQMDPQPPVLLTEEEYKELVDQIKQALD